MKLGKGNIITFLGILVYCVIIILPPIIHGYVYPNLGDDSGVQLGAMEALRSGDMSGFGYLGSLLVGIVIVWVSNSTNIGMSTLFLWFSFLSLVVAGIVLYFVMSRLINRKSGWLALILAIFCAQSVLFQFYFGQIFNLINIAIILPLLLYFTVRYLIEKKLYQLVLVIILCGLFGSFHVSGIYLPFISGFAVALYMIYSLARKRNMQLRPIILGLGIVAGSIIVAMWIDPLSLMGRDGLAGFMHSIDRMGTRMAIPVVDYLLSIVSPTVLVILVFVCMYSKDILMAISNEAKLLSILLLSGVVVLVASVATKIALDPWRQALDLATISVLFVTIPLGVFVSQYKNKLVVIILLLAVVFGMYRSIPVWFEYNSAIRPADKQAIAYINGLDYQAYNCSSEIAPWVYDRFTKAKYDSESMGELVIVRSKPMTPRSTVGNIWYGGHGVVPNDDYELTKTFRDSQVEVSIYERK